MPACVVRKLLCIRATQAQGTDRYRNACTGTAKSRANWQRQKSRGFAIRQPRNIFCFRHKTGNTVSHTVPAIKACQACPARQPKNGITPGHGERFPGQHSPHPPAAAAAISVRQSGSQAPSTGRLIRPPRAGTPAHAGTTPRNPLSGMRRNRKRRAPTALLFA